jgi:asparagine synthase (glutamine-hydrolysing)
MCGILLIWGADEFIRAAAPRSLAALKARGPDVQHVDFLDIGNGLTMAIGFTRLHIQGATAGAEQPFRLEDSRTIMCNGEIFNSEILKATLGLAVPEGSSDCAVIPALLKRGMPLTEVSRQLDGDFAIVVVDPAEHTISVSRDPYGVRPLFYGEGKGWKGFASEIKGLPSNAYNVQAVAPGTVAVHQIDRQMSQERWHEVPWLKTPYWRSSLEGLTAAGSALRHALEEAVHKRMATVRGIGACLSGGLDSSRVAAIAARRLAAQGKRLHTYSVGMPGSPDLEHARLVAAHINSIHHEKIFPCLFHGLSLQRTKPFALIFQKLVDCSAEMFKGYAYPLAFLFFKS